MPTSGHSFLEKIEPTLGDRELAYRLNYLRTDRRTLEIGAVSIVLFGTLFIYNDYLFFGFGPQFWILLAVRSLFLSLIACLVYFASYLNTPNRLDWAGLIMTCLATAGDLYIVSTRPPSYNALTFEPLVILLIYLVLPSNLKWRVLSASIISIAYLINCFYLKKGLLPQIQFVAVAVLIAGNLLGLFISVRLNNLRRKQYATEEGLRSSELRYRHIFENNKAIKLIIDPDTASILDANSAAGEFYGYSVDEMKKLHIYDINILSRDQVFEKLKHGLLGMNTVFEFKHRVANGKIRDVEVRTSPIYLDGKTALYSIVHDITESKAAEKALKESEQVYRHIFEKFQDVYYEILLDGTLVQASPSIEKMLGYDRRYVLGKSVLNFYVHPEQRDIILAALHDKGEIQDREIDVWCKDGSIKRCSTSASLIYNEKGEPHLINGVLRDITERKLFEEELQQANEEWERTFDTVHDPLIIIDSEHKILKANRATLKRLNVEADQVLGQYCYTFFHHSDSPPSFCPHSKLLADGETHRSEIYEPVLGGYFVVTVSPIFDKHGNIKGSVHLAHDISDLKAQEEKIKDSLKEKEVLLREIHHRVKNNFQMIAGLMALQSERKRATDCGTTLKEMELRILAMARVHEKLYSSDNLTEIRMHEYLSELLVDLVAFLGTDGTTLIAERDIDPIVFDIDTAIACGLVLTELVSNCVKHAFPEGITGKISVHLKDLSSGKYELMVSDNGLGLPSAFSMERTDTLGLRLVKAFIARFKGDLHYHKNGGAVFRITFHSDSFDH